MYWSVVWCSGGCCWKCHKTLTFCSLLTRCTIPCACHAKRHLYLQKWSEPLVFLTFDFDMCFAPQPRALFPHRNFQKVARTCCALYIFTSTCASRHNRVHFFDIWTSKSGPNVMCFVHFHFEMCFAPQRRALFPHRNFQKWREHVVFCTFSLQNVLRATTACTFSTSQLPKVVRQWCVLYIFTCKCASRHNRMHFFDISTSKSAPTPRCFEHFTCKCASRHNRVQFFISHLASWLRTRRFSEPTFRPSGATNHWKKHSVSRLSYLFAHLHLLSSYSFSSTLLSSNLSLLSASSLLCFSSVHIVGSLTSKLPSAIIYIYIYGAAAIILNPSFSSRLFHP